MRAYQRKDTVKPFSEMHTSTARAQGGAGGATDDEQASLLSTMASPVHDTEPRGIEMAVRGSGDVSVGVAAEEDEESVGEEEVQAKHMIKRLREMVGMGQLPPCADWVALYRQETDASGRQSTSEAGEVCLSIQIVPKPQVDSRPNGFGRDEPNNNPYCPPPIGRMELSVNPCYMLKQMLGPELWRKFCCCVGCLACAIFMAIFGSILTPIITAMK